MNTNILLVALIALIVGAGGGYIAKGERYGESHMMSDGSRMYGALHSEMQDEMNAMMTGLSGKSGEEFDKAFLAEMIVHHEGAVSMAEAALINAKSSEIQEMAKNIITAQTAEITQMKAWQKELFAN